VSQVVEDILRELTIEDIEEKASSPAGLSRDVSTVPGSQRDEQTKSHRSLSRQESFCTRVAKETLHPECGSVGVCPQARKIQGQQSALD